MEAYSAVLELFPSLRHLSQPSPAYSLPARRMEKMKVIPVTNTGNPPKDASAAEEGRLDERRARYSSQVIRVQL